MGRPISQYTLWMASFLAPMMSLSQSSHLEGLCFRSVQWYPTLKMSSIPLSKKWRMEQHIRAKASGEAKKSRSLCNMASFIVRPQKGHLCWHRLLSKTFLTLLSIIVNKFKKSNETLGFHMYDCNIKETSFYAFNFYRTYHQNHKCSVFSAIEIYSW